MNTIHAAHIAQNATKAANPKVSLAGVTGPTKTQRAVFDTLTDREISPRERAESAVGTLIYTLWTGLGLTPPSPREIAGWLAVEPDEQVLRSAAALGVRA